MVQTRDHSKQTVQVVTRSQPGSFVGVSLLRSSNYIFQADNELTPGRMLRALYDLEPFNRSVHGVTWSDREGMKPDRSPFFVSSSSPTRASVSTRIQSTATGATDSSRVWPSAVISRVNDATANWTAATDRTKTLVLYHQKMIKWISASFAAIVFT